MNQEKEKNIAHVIYHQLRRIAKANDEGFNILLARYGIERLLYRLSISPHNEQFILKGASMFLVWKKQRYRITKDADLLGFGNNNVELLADTFRNICSIDFPNDGMIYLPETLKAEKINEALEYKGAQIKLVGLLDKAKIPLHIDIGFGDIITPAPENIEYPTLVDVPPALLRAYTRYTFIAEKFETMVRLEVFNSRMKDLSPPPAFTSDFYNDSQKLIQWNAFVKKSKLKISVGSLASVVAEISDFLTPVMQADGIFEDMWQPENGKWTGIPY